MSTDNMETAGYAQVIVPVGDIDVGERDRVDMGDVLALAASIAAVGLLHPVVITPGWQLVAGSRRLAAVRELGWTEVPVTVVTLDTVAGALRAEMDENACREPLTPVEAARARERRAEMLSHDAKRRQIEHGGTAPGRPHTTANLAEVNPASTRETRKVAATGTGYSGSTLDKVDGIRVIAEQGVIHYGDQRIPAPEPVREAARQALTDLQHSGAPVDRVHRAVTEIIERHIEPDGQVARARQLKAWRDALHSARLFRDFDMTTLVGLLDDRDWGMAAAVVEGIAEQVESFRVTRPSHLRAVEEGT